LGFGGARSSFPSRLITSIAIRIGTTPYEKERTGHDRATPSGARSRVAVNGWRRRSSKST
jgi:hypothetical protein